MLFIPKFIITSVPFIYNKKEKIKNDERRRRGKNYYDVVFYENYER